jgi:hypothetical protein
VIYGLISACPKVSVLYNLNDEETFLFRSCHCSAGHKLIDSLVNPAAKECIHTPTTDLSRANESSPHLHPSNAQVLPFRSAPTLTYLIAVGACYMQGHAVFISPPSTWADITLIIVIRRVRKLREYTISFVMSVRPTYNNSVPTIPILIKLDSWALFENLSKFKFHQISNKNTGYFVWTRFDIKSHSVENSPYKTM